MREIRVQSLDQEDSLEKEIATHSSILAWRIPQREESRRLQSMGSQELDMTERLNNSTENVKLDKGKSFLTSQENVLTFFF